MVLVLFTSNTVVISCCYSATRGQMAEWAMLVSHKSPQKAATYIQPQYTQRVNFILFTLRIKWIRESSVSTATRYRPDGPGIESRWKRDFSAPVQTSSEAHPASYTIGTGSFPGVKLPGHGVDHPPHLAPRLRKSSAIPLLPLLAFVAWSRVNFTFYLLP